MTAMTRTAHPLSTYSRILQTSRSVAIFVANGIGDMVFALPTLRALSEGFRDKVTLIVEEGSHLFLFDELDVKKVVCMKNSPNPEDRKVFDVPSLVDAAFDVDLFFALVPWISPDLEITWFDVLMPDHTFDERPQSVSRFYIDLFDIWYDDLSKRGIRVRSAMDFCRAALGRRTESESIGYGPVTTFSVLTDGSFEVLDVLKIRGRHGSRTDLNILHSELDDIKRSKEWLQVLRSSLELASGCNACGLHDCCGGGYVPSRWSSSNGFDNPSVYCSDLKEIFGHVAKRVSLDLVIETE